MALPNEIIEFHCVGFHHAPGRDILADLSFTVTAGETLALLGRSGSGKSTILKLINRLLDPDVGEVRVEGTPTVRWDPIRLRRRIGYVLQDIGLLPHFTVAQNVGLVPTLEGWSGERIEHRVRDLLALVGLAPDRFAARYPHELSGGQRQRVGVARALGADPPVLLLDEPFGALDPITRVELQQEFEELQRELKKTAVLVTHDLPEACLLGTRVALLHDGKFVGHQPPEEFLKSDHPEVMAMVRSLAAGKSGP